MLDLTQFKQALEQVIGRTRENLNSVRTGRASPALIENLPVTTYSGGATLKVIELATISTSGPQDLLVIPFDPTTLPDIEKKMRETSMGFAVSVSGNQIRLKLPPLTEEQRQKYVKIISGFIEEGREGVRRERDEARKNLKNSFEKKELSENEKYRQEEEIDKISKNYTEQLEQMKSRKEAEIMTI